MTDLSVIIVNWNTKSLLKNCLESIFQAGYYPDLLEVIVVDNGSSDQSSEMVRKAFSQVTLIENQINKGFAAANNQGVEIASAPLVLLLNSDTLVPPQSLERMISFMNENREVGVLGCQLLFADGTKQNSFADYPSIFSALLGTDFRRHFNQYKNTGAYLVDAVSGACLLAQKDVLNHIGGVDESYQLFVEEVDLCYRIQKAGWLVCWYPKVEIIHLLGRSRMKRSSYSNVNIHRSRLIFFEKHYGRFRAGLLRAGYILSTAIKLVVYSAITQFLSNPELVDKPMENRNLLHWLLKDSDYRR